MEWFREKLKIHVEGGFPESVTSKTLLWYITPAHMGLDSQILVFSYLWDSQIDELIFSISTENAAKWGGILWDAKINSNSVFIIDLNLFI